MIYHKITNGFVIQRFDDTGKFLDQEFIAGNPVDYETQEGDKCCTAATSRSI